MNPLGTGSLKFEWNAIRNCLFIFRLIWERTVFLDFIVSKTKPVKEYAENRMLGRKIGWMILDFIPSLVEKKLYNKSIEILAEQTDERRRV